jgi:hypothetical protein
MAHGTFLTLTDVHLHEPRDEPAEEEEEAEDEDAEDEGADDEDETVNAAEPKLKKPDDPRYAFVPEPEEFNVLWRIKHGRRTVNFGRLGSVTPVSVTSGSDSSSSFSSDSPLLLLSILSLRPVVETMPILAVAFCSGVSNPTMSSGRGQYS